MRQIPSSTSGEILHGYAALQFPRHIHSPKYHTTHSSMPTKIPRHHSTSVMACIRYLEPTRHTHQRYRQLTSMPPVGCVLSSPNGQSTTSPLPPHLTLFQKASISWVSQTTTPKSFTKTWVQHSQIPRNQTHHHSH